MKIIKVSDKTHKDLMDIGKKKETFDAIIRRLMKDGKQD